MLATSKDGLLLEARLTSDGKAFYLTCSVEECDPFRFGPFTDIHAALNYMSAFFLGRTTHVKNP